MGKEIVNDKGHVTIKDISAKLNVSSVSVHRALTGKDGVSEKLRQQILQTAAEMGYEVNYAASSLKRKPYHVVAILPQDNGLYYSYIWKGLEISAQEAKRLNVNVEKIVCHDENHQYELLKHIADGNDGCNGVVTFSYTRQPRVLMQLQRLIAQGVSVAIVDDKLEEPEGLFCIPSNEKKIGTIAAEFITLITPEKGTVLISSGRSDSNTHQNKRNSFIQYINEKKPGLNVHIVEGYFNDANSDEIMCENVRKALQKYPDTVACYALTSHDNAPMVQAVKKANMQNQVSIVGTDLNKITADLLESGQLKAVINQAAYMKGRVALGVVLDCLVKNTEPPSRSDCPIDIILQSNLSFFKRSNGI